MDILISDQAVAPWFAVWVGGGGETAPADAFPCLGYYIRVCDFVSGLHFHHILMGGGFNQKIRVILLTSLPEQAKLIETVKAELKKTQAENAQLGVRKVRDKKTFAKKMRRSKHKYRVRESSKAAQTALLVWAITSLTIIECYKRLTRSA